MFGQTDGCMERTREKGEVTVGDEKQREKHSREKTAECGGKAGRQQINIKLPC